MSVRVVVLTFLCLAAPPGLDLRGQSNQLLPSAVIPAPAISLEFGDVDLDGFTDIVSIVQGSGPGSLAVSHGLADAEFGAPVVLPLPSPTYFWKGAVITADATADGLPDVIMSGAFNPNVFLVANQATVTVFPGLGPAGFAAPVHTVFPELLGIVSAGATGMALADMNGDGRPDIVLGTQASGMPRIQIGLGDASGGFTPLAGVPVERLGSIAVADVDGDHRLDVIATRIKVTQQDPPPALEVFLGAGNGHLVTPPIVTPLDAAMPWPFAPVATDMDHDGLPDLLATSQGSPTGVLALLRNAGDGTFEVATTVPMPGQPNDPAVGDVDGDGTLDFVVAVHEPAVTPSKLAVVFGQGGFAVDAPQVFEVPLHAYGLSLADFDRDGELDMGFSSSPEGLHFDSVTIVFNHGDGSFAHNQWFESEDAHAVAAGDLNGDGWPDLVSPGTPNSLVVLSDGAGGFTTSQAASISASQVVLADFDGNGKDDLAYSGPPSTLFTALSNGDGTFAASVALAAFPTAVFATDFDGDGQQDVIAVVGGSSSEPTVTLKLWKGHGDGGFEPPQFIDDGPYVVAALIEDLDGDGVQDAALTEQGVVTVRKGLGGGSVGPPVVTPLDENVWRLAAADFDRDGLVDLVGLPCTCNSDDISVLMAEPGLTYEAPALILHAANSISSVATTDINRDGLPDLLCTLWQESLLSVLLGQGEGTFAEARDFFTGKRPTGVITVDLDRDGFSDVALANDFQDRIEVLLNQSDVWSDLGFALAAPGGAEPALIGRGDPISDQEVALIATGAPSGTAGLLLIGLDTVFQPFQGGTIVPTVDAAVLLRPGSPIDGHWPKGFAPGTPVYFQAWFATPAAGGAISATNALVTIAQ